MSAMWVCASPLTRLMTTVTVYAFVFWTPICMVTARGGYFLAFSSNGWNESVNDCVC